MNSPIFEHTINTLEHLDKGVKYDYGFKAMLFWFCYLVFVFWLFPFWVISLILPNEKKRRKK